MRLGLSLGYAGASMGEVFPLVARAEEVGFDSVWVAEAYGSDAVSVLGWLAGRTERIGLGSAVLQMPARTPATTAMSALTLDALSGGRLLLGLGASGPQVVEGWHGVAYGKPLAQTREYIDIVRAAIAREEPLSYQGEHYRIPYDGPDATGLGRPLKSILRPTRPRVPIYLAAIGPRNIRLAGEIADGWLPVFYSPEREDVLVGGLDDGIAQAGRTIDDVDVAATVPVALGPDLGACRDLVRPFFALYVGGMGARGRNFYFDLMVRYGYADAASRIQDAYLDGRREDAAAAVPDEMVDDMALVGPLDRIVGRAREWAASRVGTLVLGTWQPEVLAPLREAL